MPATNAKLPDELDLRLALIEHQVGDLVNPNNAAAEIADVLDALYAQGADAEALDVVDRNANELLNQADQLKRSYQVALETARTIKAALDEFKRQVENGDRRNPLVDDLLDKVYEEANQDAYEVMSDMFYEDQAATIENETGLNGSEAGDLINILTGDHNLNPDDPAWDELREWINAVMDRAYPQLRARRAAARD